MRLINADEFFKNLTAYAAPEMVWGAGDIEHKLDEMPTIEAEPVRHGRWIEKPTGRYGQWQSWCSACGKHSGIGGIESNRHKPYCPNCGAKMDLEEST